jgi:hypothetical protein
LLTLGRCQWLVTQRKLYARLECFVKFAHSIARQDQDPYTS